MGAHPGAGRRPARRWWSSPLAAATGVLLLVGGGLSLAACGGSGSDAGTHPAAGPSASGGSARPAGRATPEPSGTLDATDAHLVAMLRPFAVTDCHTAPRGAGVSAAVDCVPGVSTAAAAPGAVSVVRYTDAATLRADVGRRSAALTDVGECSRGQTSIERWAHSSRRRGTFLCSAVPDRFSVFWTVDDELLGFSAEDSDAARLLAWWRDYDPV
ncbi:hypothetical protein [Frankia canadensis]|uniref:hypothetical protein n=1 Tax=Frankia canadensis TaxID=1836972 RepID=UPI001A9CAE9C|nr:hypothetical protein [Frankia canadensis]